MRHPTAALALLGVALGCTPQEPPAPPPPAPPPAPVVPTSKSSVDRSHLPAPGPRVQWTPPAASVNKLDNDIRVWHLKHGSSPIVSLLMVIPRGAATDPKGKAGLTYLVADMLDEGAGKLSALQLSDEFQRLATDFSVSTDVDYVLLSMDLLRENFTRSVELLADIVRRPTLSPAEFKRRKDYFIAQAISNESSPRAAKSTAMLDVLFGDGYAGQIDQGTQKTLKPIQYWELKQHYKNLVTPDGVEFIVVGGIERDTVMTQLGKAFGDWKGKAKVTGKKVNDPPKAHDVYVVDFPGAEQSVVSVVRRAPGAQAEDYFPAMVFNRGFGEAFTSRLNLNLREDKGYTYGARSGFQRYRVGGFFVLSADVKSETTQPSVVEMLKELGDVCQARPITAEERDEAVSGLLLGYPSEFETIDSTAYRYATLVMYQRPVDWFQKWPSNVEAVNVEAANEAARRYCNPAEFSIVLAGDRAKLEEDLSKLGRKIVGYDRQGKRLD